MIVRWDEVEEEEGRTYTAQLKLVLVVSIARLSNTFLSHSL